jgi:PAS domain S-box-containing protein
MMRAPVRTVPSGQDASLSEAQSGESTEQENELFRAAFERSAAGMAHLSPAGIFLRVNAELCAMTGYEPAELTGMNFRQITLDADFGPIDEVRRARLAREGGSYTVERRYVRKNGEIFWVQIATTMLSDGKGQAKYGMSVIEDVTQRKIAEFRLQRLNRLHGVVSKISASCAQANDRQSLFALACRIAVQRGGLRLALIVEKDAASGVLRNVAARESGDGVHAMEDLDTAIASGGAIGDAVRGGQRAVCTTRAIAAPGDAWQRMALLKGIGATGCFPLLIGGAAIGALVVSAVEADYFQGDEVDLLTAAANCMSLTIERLEAEHRRKVAEEQVRRQESMLASAGRMARIGSWDLDLTTGRGQASDEAMRIFGLDRVTFDGTSAQFLQVVHPADREAVRGRLANATVGDTVDEMEYRVILPDGEERVILGRGTVVDSAAEATGRRIGMVMDITDRRRAEVLQQRHADRLAALVEVQRTLVHSEATVEQLFDRIPELASSVVHADDSVFERVPVTEGLSVEVIRLDCIVRSDDVDADARPFLAPYRASGMRSVLATVVRDSNGPIGVLKLFGRGPAQFGPSEGGILELLAETLGAVVQRKRADVEVKRSLQIQAGIARIQQEMISSNADPQAMLDLMVARAHELTGGEGAAILLVEGQDVIHRSASGMTIGPVGLRLPMSESLVGRCIESNALLGCDDSETDPRVNAAGCREFGARSLLAAPLRVGSVVTGALVVVSGRAHAFAPRDASALQILAQWMGAIMERGAAAAQLQASAAQYQLVFAASPLPMWVYDVQTLRFLAVNDAALAKYGYSKAEFLAMTIRDIRPAEDALALDRHLTAGEHLASTGTLWQHRTREGAIVDVEVSSSAIAFGERQARLVLAHDITVRRNAERQLLKSEAILAIAGRVAHVAGWSFDLKGRVFEFSDELWNLHELPRGSSVSPKQAIGFYAPESRAAMIESVDRCALDGTPYDLELEIITAQGRRIGVRTIGNAVRDSSGAVVGIQGAVQDISERKQAAEQLRALAARLTRTLESITDGFCTLDPEWRFTYVNAEAERFLQRPRSELIGREIWEMFPLTTGGEIERRFRGSVAAQKSAEFEVYLAAQRLWMELHVYPSEAGLTVYGRDVTKRRQADEQLKLLEACVAHMLDVVIISQVNPDGQHARIVFVNEAFVRCTGYSRAEARGQTPRMLHGPLTERTETNRILQALRAGEPARAELIYYRKDGSTYWVELEVVPVRSPGGQVTHWIGVQRDTTERRQAQEALGALNETLESRVVERTAALELARHDAEQASRAKSAFVATMSHEIRTPMNGVIGMLDVLEQSDLAADQSKMLELARDSAHSLMAVIEDILDFSKIEAGKVELERMPVSVADIVESVCAMVAGGARTKGVEVLARVDPSLPQAVWGDPIRLRQVLVNLTSNAVKFSGHSSGGGRVAVSAKKLEGGPGRIMVELAVEDNGIGMAESTVDALFRPFSQADASTTRRFGGTGLGLTITKHLVELMGGRIDVESKLDVGSTFVVRLPFDLVVAPERTPVDSSQTNSAVAVRRPPGFMHPGTLLVAEDNPINREVIAAQLELLGYAAEISCNGREALLLWRSGRFTALLTDLQMPEMDGYDLAASIRREEGPGARLPIIALTANAVKEEADRCLASGMDDLLTKPVTLTALESVLERQLGKAGAAATLACL